MNCVVFMLGEKEFGIPVEQVMEILREPEILTIPECPEFLEGVVVLRNHSLAVIDLAKKFELERPQPKKNEEPLKGYIIVAKASEMIVGIHVDRVIDILNLHDDQVDTTSDLAGDYLKTEMVSGVARVDHRVIILLDATHVLNPKEKDALSEKQG